MLMQGLGGWNFKRTVRKYFTEDVTFWQRCSHMNILGNKFEVEKKSEKSAVPCARHVQE